MSRAWLYDDINDRHADQARADRQEHRDAAVDYDRRDEAYYPDAAEIAALNAEVERDRNAWIAAGQADRSSR